LTDLRVHHVSTELDQEISEKRPGAKIHGAYHRFMIADRFLVSFDQAKQKSISVGEQFTNPYVTLLGNTWGDPVPAELLAAIKEEVVDWLSESAADAEYSNAVIRSTNLSDILRAIHALITTKRRTTPGEPRRT